MLLVLVGKALYGLLIEPRSLAPQAYLVAHAKAIRRVGDPEAVHALHARVVGVDKVAAAPSGKYANVRHVLVSRERAEAG